MRYILTVFVVLAVVSPAWAGQGIVSGAYPQQVPTVSNPVPNIQPPGAGVVTSPYASGVYQTSTTAPATATLRLADRTVATGVLDRSWTRAPSTLELGDWYIPTEPAFEVAYDNVTIALQP